MHRLIRFALLSMLTCALAALLAASGAQARPTVVTLMTRNLFIGGDYTTIAIAPPAQFPADGTQLWRQVQASDPPRRLKLVAAEVARANPDVLAVQEAALWRTGPLDGYKPDATHVVYDFVAMLKHDLAARHLHYRLAAIQSGVDVEGPTDIGFDVRIGNSNAIFVRRGVRFRHARGVTYRSQIAFPSPTLGPVSTGRGYASVDLTVGGRSFRVVDTQLEAFSASIRADQARELVAGPLHHNGPVFLLGDLNSPAGKDAYKIFTAGGLRPRRTSRPNCCFKDNLKTGVWDHIVDWIMSKPKEKLVRSYLTGGTATTPVTHLHASDHGGVVSVVRFR